MRIIYFYLLKHLHRIKSDIMNDSNIGGYGHYAHPFKCLSNICLDIVIIPCINLFK